MTDHGWTTVGLTRRARRGNATHAWHGKRLSRSALADAHLGLIADHVAEELKELVCIVDVLSQGHRLGFSLQQRH